MQKNLLWLGLAVIAILLILLGIQKNKPMPQTSQTQPVQITPISHATAILNWDDAVFYVDPVGGKDVFEGRAAGTIILVTDIHGDHFSASTLADVLGPETALIVPQAVKDQLPENLSDRAKVLMNGEEIIEQGFNIAAIPMYNLPDSENSGFHTKGRGNGYVIEKDGFRVYLAGDTAGTPEMRALDNIDIAFVPMNLPYTMSVEEAAGAVLDFKPKQVYPYHYRGPDGLADVNLFQQLVNAGDPDIEVILADWYPE